MIKDLNFQSAVFLLSYQSSRIARITYTVTGAPNPALGTPMNATQSVNKVMSVVNITRGLLQTSIDSNTTGVDTVDPTNDPHLQVAFQLTGSVIPIYNIFQTALDILRDWAFYDRTGFLGGVTTQLNAVNLVIQTRSAPGRTRQDPPYFQIEWPMRALGQMPAYMLEQQSFREVDMVLFVDGIIVEEVAVKKPGGGTGLMQASGDVSSS